MKTAISFVLILIATACFSQTSKYNLDFERSVNSIDLPDNWVKWGEYNLKIDSVNVQSGNKSVLIDGENGEDFGSVAYKLPSNFKGKTIKLEGYIKFENVTNGYVGLLLRIDKDGQSVEFDNMASQNLSGSHDWKKYSITLNFAEDADYIYVGGILVGRGKAWFDNFKVTIDGKSIENLKLIERQLSIIEKDNEFDKGSKFEITSFNETERRNLFVLGKVWGFVKYYHPTIAKGEISWDYELFRIFSKINQKNFDAELVNWINKLGAFKTKNKKDLANSEVKLQPNTKWIDDKNLISNDLSALLQKINSAKRSGNHYYIDFHKGVLNPKFTNEKVYSRMDYSDSGIKLLAVFRYWNMIEYYFPNRHLMDENWDAVLKDYIPKICATKDEKEYTLKLLELIGKIQDTHASISGYNESLHAFFGVNKVPIKVKFVQNKLVVTELQKGLKENSLEVGTVITAINGVKVEDWITANRKYFPASNVPVQLRDMAHKITRTNENVMIFTIENKGQISDFSVSTQPYKYVADNELSSHKLINNTIGYIYPETLKKGEISEIITKFKETKGLIVDLRCYPSEFIGYVLGEELLPENELFVRFTNGSIETPGLFTEGKTISVGKKNKDNYKGKVIILINEETQSQAEYTVMALRKAPNSIVLGSTTAGADGNMSAIQLPGNISTYISGIGVLNPDRTETQRVGIIPDVFMEPTVKGIIKGKDEILEKAIELISK